MRIILYIFVFLLPCLSVAQTKTTTRPSTKKSTVVSQSTKKRTDSPTQKKTIVRPTTKKSTVTPQTVKKKSTSSATPIVETKQIKQLRGEQQMLKRQINESELLLQNTKKDVRSQLNTLTVLTTQIGQQKLYVDGISLEVTQLTSDISLLTAQLDSLHRDLTERKNKYAKSVQYVHRNRMTQSNLLFVLSARSFRELRRRLRYVRSFAKFQREQGEQIRQQATLVREREAQLRGVKVEKDKLLATGRNEQVKLEQQQAERQKVVEELGKQEATLRKTIASQRAKSMALDAKIDRMIQAEIVAAETRRKVAEAKRKAEAEAKRKAEEEVRRKAELASAEARRKAAIEAERQRKTAERKRQEAQRLRQEAARAEVAGRTAKAQEVKARAERAKAEAEVAEAAEKKARKTSANVSTTPVYIEPSNDDRRLSSSFEANRGRLPAPISTSYAITSRYGSYSVEGLKGVQLDNKGVNLTARSTASACAVFDGEVSTIFSYGGLYNIIVRHGAYMSVYCNLSSVAVRQGQRVSTRQPLGNIASDGNGGYTLHFQLRKETAHLNPATWFR